MGYEPNELPLLHPAISVNTFCIASAKILYFLKPANNSGIFFCRLPAVSGCAAAGYVPPGRCAVPCPLPACLLLPRLPPGMWMDAPEPADVFPFRGRRADSPEHPIVSLSRNRRVGVLGDFLSGVSPPLVPAGVPPPLCSSTYPYLPCLSPSAPPCDAGKRKTRQS